MALKQRPVSKTSYRLKPYVALGLAAFLMGTGTFLYFNFGNSFSSMAATISSYPYSESFENDLGDWLQVSNDDFDWTRKSGKTPSNYTGPSGACDGSYYLFIEANGNIPSDTSIIEANFDFSLIDDPLFNFSYHMYGSEMGELFVDVENEQGVFAVSGQQQASMNQDWITATVDLSDFGGQSDVTIRIRAVTGTKNYHDRGDIAIDNVAVTSASLSIINSFPYTEDFETGSSSWINIGADQFDWTRRSGKTPTNYTGPGNASNGTYYMFAEADAHLPSDTAIFEATFDLSTIATPELSFHYHMYGSETGQLFLDVNEDITVFSMTDQQNYSYNEEWLKTYIDLSAYAGDTVTLRFRAVTGNTTWKDRGDMAIDNITLGEASTAIVNSYPHDESFESGYGPWKNSGDDQFDWRRRSGTTPTSYTGPTIAKDGSYYLYAEADKHLPSDTAIFEATFDLSGLTDPEFSFNYHMYGSEMGQLLVDIENELGVFHANGKQHWSSTEDWIQTHIDLSSYIGQTISIKIRAITGTKTYHDRGDIAIDQLRVGEKTNNIVSTFPYCESFESGMGNWINIGRDQFDWRRKSGATPTSYTGPNTAGDGTKYLYTEADSHLPSDTAIVEATFNLNGITNPELSFMYFMYGSEMGELYLDIDGDKGVFEASGKQNYSGAEEWMFTTVDLSSYSGQTVTIKFRSITGTMTYHDRGDIAIDKICIYESDDKIIDSYPYCESFETGAGNWDNISFDQFDWKRKSGTTPTSYTGPPSAADGTYYFYAEADANLPSDTAIFEATFDLSSLATPELSFMYYMYGSEMGQLYIDIDNTSAVFEATGKQQHSSNDEWIESTIDLSDYIGQTVDIRFRAITGKQSYHDRGDIAIDNFCIYEKTDKTISSYPYCESFENGLGNWDNIGDDEFDWTRKTAKTPTSYTGPNNAHDGSYYMYAEADAHIPSDTAIFEATFDLSSISDPQISFYYHMYGSEMGSLFMDVANDKGLFAVTSQQHHTASEEWIKVTVDLSSYAGSTVDIRFRAITGSASYHDRGDICIDQLCVSSSSLDIINSFPYCESFESGNGKWKNIGADHFDWKSNTGSTPTSYTGPSSAADGSKYLFTEADKHLPAKTAIYEAVFDFSSIDDPELSFSYHMYGSEMGELFVDVGNDQGLFHVKKQQQHNSSYPWNSSTVDLSAYGGDIVSVRFRVVTGSASYHDRGDIAIDNVCIKSTSSVIVASFPYCESFESGLGEWRNIGSDNFDWINKSGTTPTAYTGPSKADIGNYYVYIEADHHLPNDTSILEAIFDFTNETSPNISFSYHMYGSEMGELYLDVNDDKGVISLSGQQQSASGQPYQNVNVNLSAYAGDTAIIRFRAITGNTTSKDRGDIAIDNISVLGPCHYWTGTASTSWNDNSNWSTGKLPQCDRNIIIPDVSSGSNNYPVISSGTEEVRDIEIESGAQITVQSGGTLEVCGNWINQGSDNVGTGMIIFTGFITQNIKGYSVFENTKISNSGSGIQLYNDMPVMGTLDLTDGIISTGANKLIINNSAGSSITRYSDSSFVNGNLRRIIGAAPNADAYIFPVGNGNTTSNYHPAEITNGSLVGTTYIDISFHALTNHIDADLNVQEEGSPFSSLCRDGVWKILPDAEPVSGDYDIKLYIDKFSDAPVSNQFAILKRPTNSLSGADWVCTPCGIGDPGISMFGGPGRMVSNGYALRNGLTAFSEFAIGKSVTALPIELMYFEAKQNGSVVDLYWATASELDNAFFTIERSKDGIAFDALYTIPGAGNSTTVIRYDSQDDSPLPGTSYYRLKQTDYNGQYSYSDIEPIRNTKVSELEMNIYPIPAKDHVNIDLGGEELSQYDVVLVSMSGQIVRQEFIQSSSTMYQLDLRGVKSGVYQLTIIKGESKLTKKVVIESDQ